MGQRTLVQLYDDITGQPGDDIETRTFALDGTGYELELNTKNGQRLTEALEEFIGVARVAYRPRGRKKSGSATVTAGSKEEARAARAWAHENGIEVSARGRVPAAIVEQYRAAGG